MTPPPEKGTYYAHPLPSSIVGLLTSHPVLTVRPDSPALQAMMSFEDTSLIYFRNYGRGQTRAGSSGDGPPASQGTTK